MAGWFLILWAQAVERLSRGLSACRRIFVGNREAGSVCVRVRGVARPSLQRMLIVSLMAGAISLTLTGAAMAVPVASLSADSLAFGDVTVGDSQTDSVYVKNDGDTDLEITGITHTGPDSARYSVTPTSATVAAGDSVWIRVTFTPGTVGSKPDTLQIAHDASGSPALVALGGTGTAVPAPVASVSSSSIGFGDVTVGDSKTDSVYVKNIGTGTLSVSEISVTSGPAGDYMIVPTSGSVPAGDSLKVVVSFTPAAAGDRTATLTVATDGGSPTVSLAGTGVGVPAATLTTSTLAYGDVNVSTTVVSLTKASV